MEIFTGIFYHTIGASSASLCYTPQKKVRNWSWQTYWMAQAMVCWLILPVLIAMLTVPQLGTVIRESPSQAKWESFLLGAGYGVGGTAFGLAIRYVGFSLTYAISVGISCVLGTLLPTVLKGDLPELLNSSGSSWVMTGISLGVLGIALCGIAGRQKERNLLSADTRTNGFDLKKGLPICLLAGILSAFYGFAIGQGEPIAQVAELYGAGHYRSNAIYIFSNSGAFLTTFVYCMFLHMKEGTLTQYYSGRLSGVPVNFFMASLTGLLWYGQFFFYGLGHVRLGDYKFSSWAIHMILLVLISTLVGVVLKEWKKAGKAAVKWLILAVVLLLAAVVSLTYGNFLGTKSM